MSAPLYSVRFNTPEQIQERELHPGLVVFYAPDAPEYTHYVFMAHLQRLVFTTVSVTFSYLMISECSSDRK